MAHFSCSFSCPKWVVNLMRPCRCFEKKSALYILLLPFISESNVCFMWIVHAWLNLFSTFVQTPLMMRWDLFFQSLLRLLMWALTMHIYSFSNWWLWAAIITSATIYSILIWKPQFVSANSSVRRHSNQ